MLITFCHFFFPCIFGGDMFEKNVHRHINRATMYYQNQKGTKVCLQENITIIYLIVGACSEYYISLFLNTFVCLEMFAFSVCILSLVFRRTKKLSFLLSLVFFIYSIYFFCSSSRISLMFIYCSADIICLLRYK